MENRSTTETIAGTPAETTENASTQRRRRSAVLGENLRYFLIKPGSSPGKPELGQEMSSEGEALIEAFRSGQPFYTVTAWKAVPEVNGGNPVIVKREMATKPT